MTYAIRRATADDAQGIYELLHSAFGEFQDQFTPELFVAALLSVEIIEQRMAEGPIWVATQGDHITGTVGAVVHGDRVYVRSMAVAAAMRGQRVGEKLLQYAESFARSVGAKSLYLNTTTFLFSAHRLYRRYGFTEYDAGEPELLGTPIIWFTMPLAGKESQLSDPAPNTEFTVRPATTADAQIIARHRCEMFKDMGSLRDDSYDAFAAAAEQYFRTHLGGEYHHWLAAPKDDPEQIACGGGAQLRYNLPSLDGMGGLRPPGPQGLIVNVYTEPTWRKRGLANLVMQAIIDWSKANNVQSLVLHASEMGRPIYEKMGFTATNEMSYPYALLHKRENL